MKKFILLFVLVASAIHAETDVAALEKRVADLEAEVANLKKQLNTSATADGGDLDSKKRLDQVADEVRRRRAMREDAAGFRREELSPEQRRELIAAEVRRRQAMKQAQEAELKKQATLDSSEAAAPKPDESEPKRQIPAPAVEATSQPEVAK